MNSCHPKYLVSYTTSKFVFVVIYKFVSVVTVYSFYKRVKIKHTVMGLVIVPTLVFYVGFLP